MSYEKIDNIDGHPKDKSIMQDVSTMTRKDIVKFFMDHKWDNFNEQESEELLNKLVKWKKWTYIFLNLDQYKLSDYNTLMDSIIDGWGSKYIINYMFMIERLNIRLDESIADKLKNLWYWTIVRHHKNVFSYTENKNTKKWPYIISPNDPRNFYGC